MQELFPGLYVITRAMTNCFLIESAVGELTLIDTGMPGMSGLILRAMASKNYQPEQLKHILLTHADFDHVGSLAKLVSLTGATVYAGEKSVPFIESGKAAPHVPSLMAAFANSLQKKAHVDVAVSDGEILPIADGMLAIHVPGHTSENYNFFWQKEGVLFAADLFFALSRDLTLSPRIITWDNQEIKKSAMKALELAPTIICPGHGNSVNLVKTPEAIAKLRRQLEGGATLAAI